LSVFFIFAFLPPFGKQNRPEEKRQIEFAVVGLIFVFGKIFHKEKKYGTGKTDEKGKKFY